MSKYTVTAVDRSGMGHPNYHTPGRAWPSGQPVEVEVLDQDDDPMLTKVVDGETRRYVDPLKIGRTSWKRICSDKMLTVRPVGDNAQDVQSMASKLSDLEAAVGAAEARAAKAEADLRKLEQDGPEWAKQSQKEVARLQGVVDNLTAEIDKANERATLAEQIAGRLTLERDDLQAQLEQLTAPPSAGTQPDDAKASKKPRKGG